MLKRYTTVEEGELGEEREKERDRQRKKERERQSRRKGSAVRLARE